MTNLNLSVDEINRMYDDEMKVLKAIDDDEREIEKQVINYIVSGRTGNNWKIGKKLVEIIKRYEKERHKCEKLPYCSGLITESIDEEIDRLIKLIDEMYECKEES